MSSGVCDAVAALRFALQSMAVTVLALVYI